MSSCATFSRRWRSASSSTVTPSFKTFVLEQLGRVVPRVRARSMFGGVGIYAGDLFFALVADDALYLKGDDASRPEFEARGMSPFRPFGEDGGVMQHYQVAADLAGVVEAARPSAARGDRAAG